MSADLNLVQVCTQVTLSGPPFPELTCQHPQCQGNVQNRPIRNGQEKELEMSKSTEQIRLDLACGQNLREGFEGVDITGNVKHKVNLFEFPWKWDENSVDELNCSHFIEHIPMEYVQKSNCIQCRKSKTHKFCNVGKDYFFAFFDECFRILKPDGKMFIACPNARSNRAFQDPTHRRFIVAETFGYLCLEWRRVNKLDHYRVECNFDAIINPIVPIEENAFSSEVQMNRFNRFWNTVLDWNVTLIAKKQIQQVNSK